jgi:pimeloyl-ACP methyl ester carboxylesterase
MSPRFYAADKTLLHYEVAGKGEPLLFIYGLVGSNLHWRRQIDYFKTGYKTIWSDFRGHHRSAMPKELESFTLKQLALDNLRLLDRLKIKETVIIAHSMGVNFALEKLRKRPKAIKALVLVGGTPTRPLENLFNTNAFQTVFELFEKACDTLPRTLSLAWGLQKHNPFTKAIVKMGGFNPHLTAEADIDEYIKEVSEINPRVLLKLIRDFDAYDATKWLHTIDIPTLIIAGREDHIIPLKQQELLNQLIPNSELDTIDHGSHCPQLDLPELVSLRIEKFLGSLPK